MRLVRQVNLKHFLTHLTLAAAALSLVATMAGCSASASEGFTARVEENLCSLYTTYGSSSSTYDAANKPYAVFDFDDTTAIHDVTLNFIPFQAAHMAYAFSPQEASDILSTGVPVSQEVESDSAYLASKTDSHLTYGDWVADIVAAYTDIYERYPVCAAGIFDEDILKTLHDDPAWQEFNSKIVAYYYLLDDTLGSDIAYPMPQYFLTGMTEQQAYDIGYASVRYYDTQVQQASIETVTGPKNYESLLGCAQISWEKDVTVTSQLLSLYKNLHDNGIDVYICSASFIELVRAAADYFGVSDYLSGIIALTSTLENGVLCNSYDYNNGKAYFLQEGKYVKSDKATGVIVAKEGKVDAINSILVSKYGYGPIACFGDSSGDFAMCTEFPSTKLVICFNCLRSSTNGGTALICAALKQEADGIDFAAADATGDTLYLVQGRNEAAETMIQSPKSRALGSNNLEQFADDSGQALYNEYAKSSMTLSEFFASVAPNFMKSYRGYHSM